MWTLSKLNFLCHLFRRQSCLFPDVLQTSFTWSYKISLDQDRSCVWRVNRLARSHILHLDLLVIASLHHNMAALHFRLLITIVRWLILHYNLLSSIFLLHRRIGLNYLIVKPSRCVDELMSVLGVLSVLRIISSNGRGLCQPFVQVSIDVNVLLLRLFHVLCLVNGDLVLP